MLDFDSEDIDGMDADEGDDEEPAPTRPWKATSSYDIYMVDTPKEGDGDGTAEDDPSKKQPKPRMQINHTRGSQVCRSFFLFSLFLFLPTGLRSSEALSGSRPTELTMQQPGKEKGYNEYPGGLHYEH